MIRIGKAIVFLVLFVCSAVACGASMAIAIGSSGITGFAVGLAAAFGLLYCTLATALEVVDAAIDLRGIDWDVEIRAIVIRARFWWRRRRALRRLAGQTTALAFSPYR